jgi:glycosyltransferase involved in cell wall biosynthesis
MKTSSPLRVLLAVAWYLPESIGGTEKYVRGLAMELNAAGVDVAIAVPSNTTSTGVSTDVRDGVRVFRFAPMPSHEFALDAPVPPRWREVLETFRPHIVDLHSITTHLGLPHLRAARDCGAQTVVTVHLPGLVCARGTLLRFGHEQCDGDLKRQPCTACRLEARGVPAPVGSLLADIPDGLESFLERMPIPDVARRAISADESHQDRVRWLGAIANYADRFVVMSDFLRAMLERNGVPEHKITVCRQGIERGTEPRRPGGLTREPDTLKVGFVGRLDPLKGLDVFLDAAERMPSDARIEFHIWGIARTAATQAYREEIVRDLQALPHVIFHGEADSLTPYEDIDVLVVPSLYVETGPFVVLEAHAAGVPVVGSNLGGIAERVVQGRNGLLFPVGDAGALAEILVRLWRDPVQLEQLRPTDPVRTVEDVARDTLDTYTAIAGARIG